MKARRKINTQVVAACVVMFVTACSREQVGVEPHRQGQRKTQAKQQYRKVFTASDETASEAPITATSTQEIVADFSTVSGLFCAVTERMELLALRDEILREKESKEKERARQYAEEERRLQSLFEQYSNRWEQIPDEYDRFKVARMIPDLGRAERILLNLMESSQRVVVADVAGYLRFFYEDRVNRPNDALPILFEGERRILGGRELSEALSTMSVDEQKATGVLYMRMAITQHMRGDGEGATRAFERAAQCAIGRPSGCAGRYVELASAYENVRDGKNAMRAYEKAEEQLSQITDRREKALSLWLWDEIQEGKRRIERGEFESTSWEQ